MKLHFLFCLFICSGSLLAQVPNVSYATLAEMSERTLLVDVESFSGEVELLKEVITANWRLNEEIVFHTKAEIDSIRSGGGKDFAVLSKGAVSISATISTGYSASSFSNALNTLSYNRIERNVKKMKKSDYYLFIPKLGSNSTYVDGNVKLAIKIIQRHIDSIIKRKSNSSFMSFAVEEAKRNCSDLFDYEWLVNRSQIESKTKPKIEANLKENMTIVSSSKILSALEEERDVLVSIAVVYHYTAMSRTRNFGGGAFNTFLFRSFVHAKTGEIYTCTGTNVLGPNNSSYFSAREFKRYGKNCK